MSRDPGKFAAACDEIEAAERPAPKTGPDFMERAEDLMVDLHTGHLSDEAFRSGIALLRATQTIASGDTAQSGNRHKLLRREARGHRRRAFPRWLACLARTNVLTEGMW